MIKEQRKIEDYSDVLTAKDIAEIMNIGYIKALNVIKYSGMAFKRIGNTYRVPKKIFVNWLYSPESEVLEFDEVSAI